MSEHYSDNMAHIHILAKSHIKFSNFKHKFLYIPCILVEYKVQSTLDEHLNYFCELRSGSFRMSKRVIGTERGVGFALG